MVYDIKNKELNGVKLSKLEWQIFEILLEYTDELLTSNRIADIVCNKYYLTGINSTLANPQSVSANIYRINKKVNGAIKNKVSCGYSISEEVKIL